MLKLRNSLLFELLKDDRGVVYSSEYIIMTTIIGIGIIVGITTFRDQLVQEFGDAGVALEQLDQSYIYVVPGPGYDPSVPFDPMMPVGFTVSTYDDNAVPPPIDPLNAGPGGILFPAGGSENDAFGTPTSDSN